LKEVKLDLIEELSYSYINQTAQYPFPSTLKSSLQIIANYFSCNSNNKICLVFPSKEIAAQWLSIPTVLLELKKDFEKFNREISESYKSYKYGDKLILNNKAIVEWMGIKNRKFNGPTFRTNSGKDSGAAEITINFSDILTLQKAPDLNKPLSKLNKVRKYLGTKDQTPLEKLLNINVSGNLQFAKNKICLVSFSFKNYY
jgi:hypothetical protein